MDAAGAMGFAATTAQRGLWQSTGIDWQPLRGRHVVILVPVYAGAGIDALTAEGNALWAGAASVRRVELLDALRGFGSRTLHGAIRECAGDPARVRDLIGSAVEAARVRTGSARPPTTEGEIRRDLNTMIAAILADGVPRTYGDIWGIVRPRHFGDADGERLRSVLKAGVRSGLWTRSGSGRAWDPERFAIDPGAGAVR
jgi:hypothetical protein